MSQRNDGREGWETDPFAQALVDRLGKLPPVEPTLTPEQEAASRKRVLDALKRNAPNIDDNYNYHSVIDQLRLKFNKDKIDNSGNDISVSIMNGQYYVYRRNTYPRNYVYLKEDCQYKIKFDSSNLFKDY